MAKQNVEWVFSVKDSATAFFGRVNKALQETAKQHSNVEGSTSRAGVALAGMEQKLAGLNAELKKTKSAEGAVSDLEELSAEARDVARALDEAKAKQQQLAGAQEAARKASEPLKASWREERDELRRLERQLDNARKKFDELKAQHGGGDDFGTLSAEKAEAQFNEMTTALERAQVALRDTRAAASAAKTLQDLQGEAAELTERLHQARKAEKALNEELRAASEPADKLKTTLRAQEQTLRRYAANVTKAQDKLAALNADQKAGVLSSKQYTEQAKTAQKTIDKFTGRIETQTKRIAETKAAYSQAEASIAGLREQQKLAEKDARDAGRAYNATNREIEKLTAVVKQAGGSVDDFQKAERELLKTTQDLDAGIAKTQQGFAALKAEMQARELRAGIDELSAATDRQRQATLQSEQAHRGAAEAADRTQKAYSEASSQANRLSAEQEKLTGKVARAKQRIAEAGAETKNLGVASRELSQKERELERETQRLKDSMRELRAQTNRTENAFNGLFRASRQSMSVYQRIRGQVLSLAAAYIGLYGAVDQIRGVVNTVREVEAANSRFRVAFEGDMKRVRQEMEFTRRASDELGLDFLQQAKAYSRLQIAAQGTNLAGENTRFIWTSLAASARALRSSPEEIDGVMRAIEQIMSKGSVQAEELRGQLGDRLPAAVNLMSAALGVGTEKLNKMLEQGQITRDALVGFAEQMLAKFRNELPAAMDSLEAKMARLGNTWRDIQTEFANSGFIDEVVAAVEELNAALKSEDGRNGARELGKLMAMLVRGFTWLLQNIETVKAAFQVLGGALVLKWAVNLFQWIMKVGNAFIWLGGLVKTGAARLLGFFVGGASAAAVFKTGVGRIFGLLFGPAGVIATLLISLASFFAKWLYDRHAGFRKWWLDIKVGFHTMVESIKLPFRKFWAYLVNGFENVSRDIKRLMNWTGVFDFDIGPAGDSLSSKYRELEAESAAIKRKLKADLEAEYKADEERRREKDKPVGDTREGGRGGGGAAGRNDKKSVLDEVAPDKTNLDPVIPGKNKAAEKEAKSLAKALDKVRNKLREIRAERARGDEAIALEFQDIEADQEALIKRLDKLGREDDIELVKELIAAQKELAEIAVREEQVNQLFQQRQSIIQRIAFLREQGEYKAAKELRESLLAVNSELSGAVDRAIALADALGEPELALSLRALRDELRYVGDELVTVADINRDLAGGLTGTFKAGAQGLANMIRGAGSFKDAVGGMLDAFRQFAADFLMKIAQMIMQQIIFNALQSSFGGFGGSIAGFVNSVPVMHSGGMVGSATRSRQVFAGAFAGAARFHGGGFPGLKSDEVPTILQKGEEVLDKDSPRNARNGGGSDSPKEQITQLQIVNALDPGEMAQMILSSSAAKRPILNVIRAAKGEINTILRG